MSFRWTEADHAAFQRRRQEWESTGAIRTHRIRDELPQPPPAVAPLPPPAVEKGGKRSRRAPKPVRLAERAVLKACLELLEMHPLVAFAWRQNTGLAMGYARAVRFSFAGCSDILGVLKGGRFFAVECKATGKTARPDQQAFLYNVAAAGGLALCVDDPRKLIAALEMLK